MPELPEVRAHAERLDRIWSDARLERVSPLAVSALKNATPGLDAAQGRHLDAVRQRGKYLILDFGPTCHVVHLMQGGRLRPDPRRSRRPRGGLVRWEFDEGRALLLTEAGREHRAGVWTVAGDPEQHGPLDRLGPEADQVDAAALHRLLGATNGRLHGWLRNQGHVAGLGRRLANEVCFGARLSPFASTARLDEAAAERLVGAIGEAITEGLAFERDRDDMSSAADRPGRVHGRAGEACSVCGDQLRSVTYRSYSVVYCPTDQTGGKVLADNTTSRFLK